MSVKHFSLLKIATTLGVATVQKDLAVNGFSIDSRTLQAGEVFIALSGPNFNGHDFIADAERRGAIAIIASEPVTANIPVLSVTNTHQAMMQLAIAHRNEIAVDIIAVTGSCGKTTTKGLLASVFQQAGSVLASEKSYNNNIGVPLTLLKLTPEHRYMIAELGANHHGEIAELTQMVKPKVAMITNAAASHLQGFGDVAGVARAKGEIFQSLDAISTAILNRDDAYYQFWVDLIGDRRIITFGLEQTADISAKNIRFDARGRAQFTLVSPAGTVEVTLQLFGRHNVQNALAAAAAGYAQDIPLAKIKKGLESAISVTRRLVEKRGINGALLIDDSYNANPLSVRAAIELLMKMPGDSVLVLADMLELGEHAVACHQQIGELARALGVNQLYGYGELTKYTVKAFGVNGQHFTDKQAMIDVLKNTLHKQMTVLIKGSNSMGMDQVSLALSE